MVCVSHIFQFACVGLVASGQNVEAITRAKAIDEVSLIQKSLRAYLSVLKRLPVDIPLDVINQDEFDVFLANMGKRVLRGR